jgi:hypothetical protein
VPTFTWGFVRWNFSFAIFTFPSPRIRVSRVLAGAGLPDVRRV